MLCGGNGRSVQTQVCRTCEAGRVAPWEGAVEGGVGVGSSGWQWVQVQTVTERISTRQTSASVPRPKESRQHNAS